MPPAPPQIEQLIPSRAGGLSLVARAMIVAPFLFAARNLQAAEGAVSNFSYTSFLYILGSVLGIFIFGALYNYVIYLRTHRQVKGVAELSKAVFLEAHAL